MHLPERVTPILKQSFVTAGVSINFIGHGCLIAFPAVLIPQLRTADSTIQVTASEESWIASILALGVIIGNIAITPIMEIFGRKKSHLFTVVPQIIGWAILYFTTSVIGILLARFIQGISMGLVASLGTIIIGETSDPKYRGVFLSFISLAFGIGNLVTHTCGTYLSWRQVTLICSSISLIALIFIIFSPETPSWLIRQGRYEDGRKIFFWLRGHTDDQESELEKVITAQKMTLKSTVEEKHSIIEKCREFLRYLCTAFKKPEFYKPVTIAFFTYSLFQYGGLNVISSYTLDIINEMVGPDSNKDILMVVLDVERLICSFLAIFVMKILKRRTFLFICGIICMLSYLSKAWYLYAKRESIIPHEYDKQWIPISLIAIYMSAATCLGTLGLSIPGEIMPLQYRGLGGGLSALTGLSINFFISIKCFPVLVDTVGLSLTYCLYASVVLVCLIVIYFLMPETKDRTLQDIEDGFKNVNTVWVQS